MNYTFKCINCGTERTKRVSATVKMPTFCSTACRGAHQAAHKPVSREWLVEHYTGKELDCAQIGKIVNRDPKSVWSWLKFYGIETRKRGYASSAFAFAKGGESKFKGRKHSESTRLAMSAIAKANGRVPYDPAVGPYCRGRFGSDHPGWKGGVTPERQALYSSKAWAACIAFVWSKSESKCERCGKVAEKRSRSFHIHHVIPFEHEPTRADVTNLVLLCVKCHMHVHSKKNTTGELIKPVPEGTP